jgi:hypothetical protein
LSNALTIYKSILFYLESSTKVHTGFLIANRIPDLMQAFAIVNGAVLWYYWA